MTVSDIESPRFILGLGAIGAIMALAFVIAAYRAKTRESNSKTGETKDGKR